MHATPHVAPCAPLQSLDEPTASLVKLALSIAIDDEAGLRAAFNEHGPQTPPTWIEELLVQSYLFCGFPRALNAAHEWRRIAPSPAPATDESDEVTHGGEWRARGEITCAAVYGIMYGKLRTNIRALHPALDAAMLVDGYGKTLSRPGLDLPRRELCIVAVCAGTMQDRQLHSHLRGALNVGVPPRVLSAAIEAIAPALGAHRTASARLLLARVVGK